MSVLIEFSCLECRKVIVWANENSSAFCKNCGKWITKSDMKEIKTCIVDDQEEYEIEIIGEQLSIF